MVSFECPKVVVVSAFSTLSLGLVFVVMSVTCCLNVSPRSKVTPRILLEGVVGIGEPKIFMTGVMLYSLLKGVISVIVDFGAETDIRLEVSQISSWLM